MGGGELYDNSPHTHVRGMAFGKSSPRPPHIIFSRTISLPLNLSRYILPTKKIQSTILAL